MIWKIDRKILKSYLIFWSLRIFKARRTFWSLDFLSELTLVIFYLKINYISIWRPWECILQALIIPASSQTWVRNPDQDVIFGSGCPNVQIQWNFMSVIRIEVLGFTRVTTLNLMVHLDERWLPKSVKNLVRGEVLQIGRTWDI